MTSGEYLLGVLDSGRGSRASVQSSHSIPLRVVGSDGLEDVNLLAAAGDTYNLQGRVIANREAHYLVTVIDLQSGLRVGAQLALRDQAFSFRGMTSGTYRLMVQSTRSASEPEFGSVTAMVGSSDVTDVEIPVTVGRSVLVGVRTAPGARCTGPVKVSLSSPFESTVVASVTIPAGQQAVTIGPVASTEYGLWAESLDGSCQTNPLLSVGLEPGKTWVTLQDPGSLSGTVAPADRTSDAWAILIPFANAATTVQIQSPDSDGKFFFRKLTSGRYWILCRHGLELTANWRPGPAEVKRLITIRPGSDVWIDSLSDNEGR